MSCLWSKKTGEKDMSFIVTTKNAPDGLILIITDKDIVGKVFEEGNKQLDLTSKFYSGTEKSIEEVRELISNAYILHLTGKDSVALGVELNLVEKERIIWINDIPHAEVLIGQ